MEGRKSSGAGKIKSRLPWAGCLLVLGLCAPLISQGVPGGGATNSDLAITKTASTNSVKVGNFLSFQLTVTNLGPDAATNVTVHDVLPTGLKYVASTGTGTYNPINGNWVFSAGSAGVVSAMTISVQATNTGTFTNTAAITASSSGDTNSNNNSASSIVTVTTPMANLQISKGVNTNSVKIGQSVNFLVSVENLGPDDITNDIVVTECLPPGFKYIDGVSSSYNTNTCLWTLSGGLSTNNFTFLMITALATNTGTYTNTVTVAVPNGVTDPNLTNNTASASVTVLPLRADLAVTKTRSGTNTVPINEPVVFFLTVTNLGSDTVSNVTLTELMPPGLSLYNWNYNSDSFFNPADGVWSILVPLASGQGSAMTLVARGTNGGTFTNTATIHLPVGVTDTNLINNSAKAAVTVLPVYAVEGYLSNCESNGLPLANVTVTLSGAGSQVTKTLPSGLYQFSFASNGNYTITPSQPGNVFVPPSLAVTVSNESITVPEMVGSIGLVYGKLDYFGSPITNHLVRLISSGFPPKVRFVFTDANGYYIFTNAPPGNYFVTAIATNGYIFTPTNAGVTLDATNCAAQTNFTALNRRGLQLVALEVVQVIQDWSNSVPLISDKATYVRAHLQLTNIAPPILLQGARLYGTGTGGALPGSPLPPLNMNGELNVQTTNAALLRGQWTKSLNFRLPPEWISDTVTLQFVCSNNVTVKPTNTVAASSSVQAVFTASQALPIKFVAYNWINAGTFQRINEAAYADLPKRIVSIYPVPDLALNKMKLVSPTTLNVPPFIPLSVRTRGRWAVYLSNAKLVQMQAFDQMLGVFGGGSRVYYGALAWPKPDTLSGSAGNYVTSSNTISQNTFVSSGFLDPAFYTAERHTHSHEIGHSLGRPHDVFANGNGACGEIGPTNTVYPFFQTVSGVYTNKPAMGPMTNGVNAMIYGLDTLTLNTTRINPVVDPNVYFDLMSYCDVLPLDIWTSSFTYTNIRASINTLFPPPPPPPPAGPPQKWFFLRGYINVQSNLGGLFPFWTMATTATNPPAGSRPGNYYALLLDGSGNLLQQIPFAPDSFILEDEAEEGTAALFQLPVLFNPAIRTVQIWNGLTATLLASITGNTNQPSVNSVVLTSTNGGAYQGTGPLVIHWSTSDADPNAQLTSTLLYSFDGGLTWETLDTDSTGQSYEVDIENLHASTSALVAVSVSDGFNSSDPMLSGAFTVPNHRPQIIINQPLTGSVFIGDQEIFLDAFVNDPQDGPLNGANVVWTSSRDGVLGVGAILNFSTTLLSEGPHLLTVTATDSVGLTNSASVNIFVLRVPPPQLAINLNSNRVDIVWPSSVTNYVLEATTNLLSGSWAGVTNTPVGADAEQTVTVGISGTSRFFRLRLQ